MVDASLTVSIYAERKEAGPSGRPHRLLTALTRTGAVPDPRTSPRLDRWNATSAMNAVLQITRYRGAQGPRSWHRASVSAPIVHPCRCLSFALGLAPLQFCNARDLFDFPPGYRSSTAGAFRL